MTGYSKDKTGAEKPLRLPFLGTKVFYGWGIVFVGFVSQIIQGLVNQGFSSYTDLLSVQFGWSRAVLAGPRSVTSVQNSLLGPVTGSLVDRFGSRVIFRTGVVVTACGLILFGMTHSLWMYYVSNIVIALGISLEGLLVVSVAVNQWFRRRGTLAQSIMLLGFSLAGVFGVPLLVFLQTKMPWGVSAIWTGIGVMVIGLPCATLLKNSPESHGLLPDGDIPSNTVGSSTKAGADVEYSFSLREAIRTRAFWFLAFGWTATSFGIGVVQVHLFLDLGQVVGFKRPEVALVWSVASITNIPARLIGGFVGDRLPKNITLGAATLLMGGAVFALAITKSLPMAFLFAVPYGIGWGMSTPLMNSIQGEYFGRKSLGVIRGWLQLVSLPFSIVAPVLVGYMADRQGTYQWAYTIISAFMLTAAIFVLLATRPSPPRKAAYA